MCVCVCVCIHMSIYPYIHFLCIHISIYPYIVFFISSADLAAHGERIDALLAHRIELFTALRVKMADWRTTLPLAQ